MIPLIGRGASLARTALIGRQAAKGQKARTGLLQLPGKFMGFMSGHAFAAQSYSDLFSRYYPSISQTINVKAQGSGQAKMNAVVHMALAAAFGTVRQKRLGSIELHVAINHTSNSCEVQFKISSLALIDALVEGSKLIDHLTSLDRLMEADLIPNIDDIKKGINRIDEEIKRQTGVELPSAGEIGQRIGDFIFDDLKRKAQGGGRGKLPGVEVPKPDEVPKPVPDPNRQKLLEKATKEVIDKIFEIYGDVSKTLGQGVIWRLGRDQIIGGRAPTVLDPDKTGPPGLVGSIIKATDSVTGADTFKKLQGKVILTRRPAINPQMPLGDPDRSGNFGFGTDLRTLVAQVLHDPGVRPPLVPPTDRGPLPVDVEELA